jgi:hypothetical protein
MALEVLRTSQLLDCCQCPRGCGFTREIWSDGKSEVNTKQSMLMVITTARCNAV